jgi:hypothetical protein
MPVAVVTAAVAAERAAAVTPAEAVALVRRRSTFVSGSGR